MFLCSLESKFHDLFKTHLTFIFKSLLRDPGSFKVKKQIFEWTPSSAHIMAPKTLRSIFYQMEHIWWAPIGLRNSSRLQLGSQLSPTLYRSFIVTLYICYRWSRICPQNLCKLCVISMQTLYNHCANFVQNVCLHRHAQTKHCLLHV